MAERESVKVVRAALDELPDGDIVLRGVIETASLAKLMVAEYQREVLSEGKILKLMEAHRQGRLPAIELGVRGQTYNERDGAFYIPDDIYVIDGQQRREAALRLIALGEGESVHQGATIYFGTTEEWERELFEKLNLGQTNLHANVTLKNKRHEFSVADALWRLSGNKSFVLCDKIAWGQNRRKGSGELISAMMYFKAAGMLHSHLGPGRNAGAVQLVEGLQKIQNSIGRGTLVQNVKTFFDVIDGAWGIRTVAYVQSAVHLHETFLRALAKLFSEHTNFWDGNKLVVEASIIRKLATFSLMDPTVLQLSGSSGKASDYLFNLLVDHINAGKRTRRLVRRTYADDMPTDEDTSDDEE